VKFLLSEEKIASLAFIQASFRAKNREKILRKIIFADEENVFAGKMVEKFLQHAG